MIEVYSITYNEEILIQFMIDHYRSRFPNCKIVFYDNSSTDKTVEIAQNNGCEVINYNSNNSLNDRLHMDIKNNCWKSAKTDWVLVCDLDELLDINQEQLLYEQSIGSTKIKSEGWTMINHNDSFDISSINHAVREFQYDKDLLFNKRNISEINYGAGAHQANSTGYIKYSQPYKLYHYKYINLKNEIIKSKNTASRLSEENIKNGWGSYCTRSEEEIVNYYNNFKSRSIKII